MKINRIIVEGLFGLFRHEIVLNNEIGITIVIGENGLGKTVLLEMINAFFKGAYFYFNDIEFAGLSFHFDDGTKWVLNKEHNNENLPFLSLTQFNKNDSSYNPIKLSQYESDNFKSVITRITRSNPYLRRIGTDIWEDVRNKNKYFTRSLSDFVIYRIIIILHT